jgi:iron complex transport system ATP-binding protein
MLVASRVQLTVPGRTLIDGLDVAFAPGECWAVLGPNGSGKTSLLHALAGLRRVAGGMVRFDDKPLGDWPRRALARRIGILLQEEAESFWGSTLDYAMLGRLAHDAALFDDDQAAETQARRALDEFDIGGHATQPYRTLSGGERQRARLAQLAVQAPEVWLLDEPLAHLDLGHQVAVMRRVAAIAAQGGTVVTALHEPLWAARVCSHALLLYDSGRFRLGPVAEVLTQEHLETLYCCRLESAAQGRAPLYLPTFA